jgi:hypothetical protein
VKSTKPTLVALACVALFASPIAVAQSCALCYTQAASAGSRMIQALQSGILILIGPPTLASIGMIFIVYRKRNQIRKAADAAESNPIFKNSSLPNSETTSWLPPAR